MINLLNPNCALKPYLADRLSPFESIIRNAIDALVKFVD